MLKTYETHHLVQLELTTRPTTQHTPAFSRRCAQSLHLDAASRPIDEGSPTSPPALSR